MADKFVKMHVEVQYVNEPKNNQRTGSIKTRSGNYISVWPNKLHLFQEGRSYHIVCKEGFWNGKPTYTFNRFASDSDPDTRDAPYAGGGNQQQGGGNRNAGGGNRGRGDDDQTAKRIFLCGVVNNAIASGADMAQADEWLRWAISRADAAVNTDVSLMDRNTGVNYGNSGGHDQGGPDDGQQGGDWGGQDSWGNDGGGGGRGDLDDEIPF